jgi:hypothetical protein
MPPEPTVYADYAFNVDRSDPVGSVLRVGTTIAKAAEVRRAQERMERALAAVDVPEEIRRSSLEQCANVLGCDVADGSADSEFVLDLEIREYGIDAGSWNAAARFRVNLIAVLRDDFDGREIWRARLQESAAITPAVFGLGGAVGNIVSAVTLSELSEEDIGRGLMRLAQSVASRAADRLERDLRRSRA